jgi:recombination protein RecT
MAKTQLSKNIDEARALATAPPPKEDVVRLLDRQLPAIKAALPRHLNPDHFQRVLVTEIRRTPALLKCDPMTVIAACMLAAQQGMEPGPLGQCYLIPRFNRKTGRQECVFQLGYKGALKLTYNSGQIASVTADKVHANDEWAVVGGDDAKIVHHPTAWGKDPGPVIGYYCVIRTKDGGVYRARMSKEQVEAHARKYSEAVKGDRGGPWSDPEQFHAMALKTVLLQALKWAPMDIEVARVVAQDDTVHHDIGSAESMLQQAEVIEIDHDTGEVTKAPEKKPQEPEIDHDPDPDPYGSAQATIPGVNP